MLSAHSRARATRFDGQCVRVANMGSLHVQRLVSHIESATHFTGNLKYLPLVTAVLNSGRSAQTLLPVWSRFQRLLQQASARMLCSSLEWRGHNFGRDKTQRLTESSLFDPAPLRWTWGKSCVQFHAEHSFNRVPLTSYINSTYFVLLLIKCCLDPFKLCSCFPPDETKRKNSEFNKELLIRTATFFIMSE